MIARYLRKYDKVVTFQIGFYIWPDRKKIRIIIYYTLYKIGSEGLNDFWNEQGNF